MKNLMMKMNKATEELIIKTIKISQMNLTLK